MIRKSIGKYRIVGQQDRGAIGTIYRATDDSSGREVAIKILSADLEDSDVVKRFRAEATVLARLNHHELSAIYEVIRAERDLLIVMEPVRGESLDELSKRSGPLPPERAGYLVWQFLGALGRAHNAGIVHGDIKPSNLIVADGGSIKIIDFGLARIAEAGRSTSDGSLMGTPVYTAPEQLLSESVDGRADLYSCGVVFYSLLTGTLPFKASNRPELMRAILHDPPTPVSTYLPDLPDWCGTIIKKALAKAPIDRFQTAEEFRGALTNAIGSAAGLPARNLSTPAVFEGAPTVVLRVPVPAVPAVPAAPVAPVAPVAPAPKVVVPPPLAAKTVAPRRPPTPAAPPPHRAAVAKPAKRYQFLIAGVVLAVIVAAAVAYNFNADPVAPATEVPDRVTTSPTVTPTAPAVAPVSPAPAATTPAIPANTAAVPAPSSATAARRPEPDPVPAVPAPAAKTAPIVPAPPAKLKPAFPDMVFDADAVIADGDKNRERDGKIVLADGKITVTEKNDRVIAIFTFDSIASISYSTARQPLWNSPAGPAELLRVEGGAFGIRRGGRNWVAFRTSDAVQVIRVGDDDIRAVIEALEARTGQPVERVAEKKD